MLREMFYRHQQFGADIMGGGDLVDGPVAQPLLVRGSNKLVSG